MNSTPPGLVVGFGVPSPQIHCLIVSVTRSVATLRPTIAVRNVVRTWEGGGAADVSSSSMFLQLRRSHAVNSVEGSGWMADCKL